MIDPRPARVEAPVNQRGFSLVETMIALGLLLVAAAGTLPVALLALNMTGNYGHLTARSSEYAQDKLEQLMALSFGDTVTDTRVFPAVAPGGSGLTVGGSADPAAPIAQYVDYLNADGALLAAAGAAPPADWFYQRVWQVEEVGAADLNCPTVVSAARICTKRITVTATVRNAASGGIVPRVTVVALKAYPF